MRRACDRSPNGWCGEEIEFDSGVLFGHCPWCGQPLPLPDAGLDIMLRSAGMEIVPIDTKGKL